MGHQDKDVPRRVFLGPLFAGGFPGSGFSMKDFANFARLFSNPIHLLGQFYL